MLYCCCGRHITYVVVSGKKSMKKLLCTYSEQKKNRTFDVIDVEKYDSRHISRGLVSTNIKFYDVLSSRCFLLSQVVPENHEWSSFIHVRDDSFETGPLFSGGPLEFLSPYRKRTTELSKLLPCIRRILCLITIVGRFIKPQELDFVYNRLID